MSAGLPHFGTVAGHLTGMDLGHRDGECFYGVGRAAEN